MLLALSAKWALVFTASLDSRHARQRHATKRTTKNTNKNFMRSAPE